MKVLLTLGAFLLLSCSRSVAPTITEQQLDCLNKNRPYVKQSVEASKQTFYQMEDDILLFETPEGTVVGYLFEQGECSTVMTQFPAASTAEAEAFIAAEVKKNYGPMFFTKDKRTFRYYTAPGPNNTAYLVAQAGYFP